MNTIITIDLSKDIIPADIVAKLRGKEETTQQRFARQRAERAAQVEEWKRATHAKINTALIEHGYFCETFGRDTPLRRSELVEFCKKLDNDFRKMGYTTGGYGEYAETNYYKWYELYIGV